jgi:hypothetical protein
MTLLLDEFADLAGDVTRGSVGFFAARGKKMDRLEAVDAEKPLSSGESPKHFTIKAKKAVVLKPCFLKFRYMRSPS